MYILISAYNQYGDTHFDDFLFYHEDLREVKKFLYDMIAQDKYRSLDEYQEDDKLNDYLTSTIKLEGIYVNYTGDGFDDYIIIKHNPEIAKQHFHFYLNKVND